MEVTKKYWKGIEELNQTPEFKQLRDSEFPNQHAVEQFLVDDQLAESSSGRRDFLKFLGFSVAAATLAACEAPVTKVVPYVNKPEDVTPGVATWYASTYYDGLSYASILVKTREARPIFIKGNKDFGFTKGGTNPQIIASVLGLYDSERLNGVRAKGSDQNISVEKADKAIVAALKAAKEIVVLSPTVISPSMNTAIASLEAAYAINGTSKVKRVQYDGISYGAIRKANEQNFGASIIPSYDFSKAKTIVSVGADFLSTWLLANEYAVQYGVNRVPGKGMSKHFQFESIMSITGSNADGRAQIKPSETANVLAYILKGIGGATTLSSTLPNEAKAIADKAISSLKASRNESLVVCGSNNEAEQLLTNAINNQLKAYGTTIDLSNDVKLYQSNDKEANQLFDAITAGKGPDVLINLGANPVYTASNGDKLRKGLSGLKMYVSTARYADESSSVASFIVPDHHQLESWNDFMPKAAHYAVAQPTIRPLGDTYSALESMLVWAGSAVRNGKDSTVAYETIKASAASLGFLDFAMLTHNSCGAVNAPLNALVYKAASSAATTKSGDWEVVFYQKTAIRDGAMSSNPWLQELPDPISKVTWDNYITMNPVQMEKMGFVTTYDQEHGLNMASLTVNGQKLTLPVYPQPGQAFNTVGIALGYGRGANGEAIGRGAYQTKEYGGYDLNEQGNRKSIGLNVFPYISQINALPAYSAAATIAKVDGEYLIAATQIHHTVMGRDSIVRETTLSTFLKGDKEAFNPAHKLQRLNEHGHHEEAPLEEFDLWNAHPIEKVGHRWGMTIDLTSCIGCGSCLVACQAENNVPVVGKDEVRRGREMHWLRIDRYYASAEESSVGKKANKDDFSYSAAEIAAVNPAVVHMPLMCQHCNHAPCETVCPVAATTHSNEGLNQMTYNRCIGTRYCANNCPYKVRRFNWFNYPSYKKFTEVNPAQDDLGRMVLNPDVTVRTRGVMEKCSFCVQRIQSTKLTAKKEARPVMDGELATACSEACPTNAIVVGDWNDDRSAVKASSSDHRAYQALEEVGVKPNVWYKVKVRN
ncbi:MAG: TAT-variant-translocated molybdopterin oxidoreductase [Cryomorphaceae bacterium]|jgi:MoCo/4Fe-4S cofactor protein with predicted Tat translocation signal|nr:TAT-variant-translocated molybdopterin oxidoreductase [Cryomorphaceae bacterium]